MVSMGMGPTGERLGRNEVLARARRRISGCEKSEASTPSSRLSPEALCAQTVPESV